MIKGIGQIAITVKDLDRAVGFYRDALGLKFLFQPGNLAFFDCGGIRLMLTPPEKPTELYSSILYLRVDDIESAHQELASRGVAFEATPHLIARMDTYDLWMAFFRDTESNLLALMCEKGRATSSGG